MNKFCSNKYLFSLLSYGTLVHELDLGLVDFELAFKLVVDSFRYHRKSYTEFNATIQHCKVIFSSFYVIFFSFLDVSSNKRGCSPML
jgi:hypothetical protein